MNELDRRSLLKAITAVPFAYCEALSFPSQEPVTIVASSTDRTGHPHKAARANSHLDFKVLTRETNGHVFIMENRDMARGGPPRHVHYEQEEWFFFLEGGEVTMEIGEQKIRLKPGDSVLAPRKVPHVGHILGSSPDACYLYSRRRRRSKAFSRKPVKRTLRSWTRNDSKMQRLWYCNLF
jgi:mannose-6-phosphate isomerase-like protein (cupin superfamily)